MKTYIVTLKFKSAVEIDGETVKSVQYEYGADDQKDAECQAWRDSNVAFDKVKSITSKELKPSTQIVTVKFPVRFHDTLIEALNLYDQETYDLWKRGDLEDEERTSRDSNSDDLAELIADATIPSQKK